MTHQPLETRARPTLKLGHAILLGWALLVLNTHTALADPPASTDFAHDIVPLIKTHCAKCHTNGTYKGGFSLDSRETMVKSESVVAGKSTASELVERITSDDPEFRMPPKGPRLSSTEVDRIKRWIDEGLPWEKGFSFKNSGYVAPLTLKRVTLPPAQPGRDQPVDRIIDAYLSAHQLKPSPALDDAGFIRRVSIDLIGLLPTPPELDAFQKDTAPDKRKALIQRLLDDRRGYAVHWLSFWNDLLRNDYKGVGYTDGGRKQITGWLYQSLLENKPYNRFVTELISPAPESEGFTFGIEWRGRVNASQVREIQFSQNVSQVFFGINMKCASCHDSFIDRWKLDDAYGLAAIIADKPLEISRCDKPTGRMAAPRFLWPELGSIDASQPKLERLAQFAKLVTDPGNGRFSRTIVNRVWQRLMGRGIVSPVDVMANEPWSEDLLDFLAADFVENGYDLKRLIAQIVGSQAYQARAVPLAKEAPAGEYVFRGPEVKRMSAEQFIDAVWMLTTTGPARADAPVRPESVKLAGPLNAPFVRAGVMNVDLLMRSLGRPIREQVVSTRGSLLTTLQALDLSNGQVLTDTLAKGAAKLLRELPGRSPEDRVKALYIQALCRPPTPDELATAIDVLGAPVTAESLADLLWVVFMLPEFQLIR